MGFRKYISIVGVLLSLSVQAEEGAIHKDSINVALGEWPPYLSESLENKGAVAQLITDIFASEGIAVNLKFFPWGRAYAETANGSQDLMGVWMHKPDREADFYYSDPVLTETFVFFHLKTFSFQWKSLSDLEELTIGGGIGYSYGSEFDAALDAGKLKIHRVATTKQNFDKLIRSRIQVYPQERSVGYAALRQYFSEDDVQKITHHPSALLKNQSYVLFPRKLESSKSLLSTFNRRLNEFKKSGRYDTYFDQD